MKTQQAITGTLPFKILDFFLSCHQDHFFKASFHVLRRSCESGTSCARPTTRACRCRTSSASSWRSTWRRSSKPCPSTCKRCFTTTAKTAASAARGRLPRQRLKSSWRQNCSACNRHRICNEQNWSPTDWSDFWTCQQGFSTKASSLLCRLIWSNEYYQALGSSMFFSVPSSDVTGCFGIPSNNFVKKLFFILEGRTYEE